MPATIIINRLTGSGPSKTAITSGNTRGSASDNAYTNQTTNSVLIPDVGNTNYSYWITTRLERTDSDEGVVDNLKWYTDGSNNFGTGITCKAQSATSYVQATGTEGESGTPLTTVNHAGLTGSPVNAFTFTSGSPKTLSGSASGAGQFGDRMVYQYELDNTTSAGASAQETFTWKYDDTTP